MPGLFFNGVGEKPEIQTVSNSSLQEQTKRSVSSLHTITSGSSIKRKRVALSNLIIAPGDTNLSVQKLFKRTWVKDGQKQTNCVEGLENLTIDTPCLERREIKPESPVRPPETDFLFTSPVIVDQGLNNINTVSVPNTPQETQACLLKPSKKRKAVKKRKSVSSYKKNSSRRTIRSVVAKQKRRMLNGYSDGRKSSTDDSPSSELSNFPPIATLGNLGNTCFLNSVLYTLRFTPNFVHNLHHLASELNDVSNKKTQIKSKTASLGRNVSSGKTWNAAKDILSVSPSNIECSKSKIQVTTEKLHLLFEALHTSEMKEVCHAYQAEDYLNSLRDVNPYFDGNQQHDAHELLVCLLNNLHETCILLAKLKDQLTQEQSCNTTKDFNSVTMAPSGSGIVALTNNKSWGGVRKSWKKRKDKTVEITDAKGTEIISRNSTNTNMQSDNLESTTGIIIQMPLLPIEEDASTTCAQEKCTTDHDMSVTVDSFVVTDFQGVAILNTTCLECEHSSIRKEVFSDICVPIIAEVQEDDSFSEGNSTSASKSASEIFQSAIVTTEYLRDCNKYWCLTCTRYNEAKRSIQYEHIPKLLTLQLKRFASSVNATSKISDHMPTPLVLACFCTRCCALPEEKRPHRYQLYGVIMHLGQAIASGHYIAYVRASENINVYNNCQRDINKSSSLTPNLKNPNCDKSSGFFRFFKNKSGSDGNSKLTNTCSQTHTLTNSSCRGKDCCGVKLNRLYMTQFLNGSAPQKRKDGSKDSKQSACVDDVDSALHEYIWLECDDENVRPVSIEEFQELLGPKSTLNSGQTPYLLFYSLLP